MAILGTDESGLTNGVDYYFRYDLDGSGFIESSINPNFGDPVTEVTHVDAVADSSGSLESTYFNLSSPTTDYYVWHNKWLAERFDVQEETLVTFNTEPLCADMAGYYWNLNSGNDATEYYVWYNSKTEPTDAKKQIAHVITPTGDQLSVYGITTSYRLYNIRSTLMSDSKVLMVGSDYLNSLYGTAAVLTIVNGEGVFNTSVAFNALAIGACDVARIDDTRAFIIYNESGTDTIKCIVATVTGTTITYGTPQTIRAAASGAGDLVKAVLIPGTEKIAVSYETQTSYAETGICEVSGTNITVGTMIEITAFEGRIYNKDKYDIAAINHDKYMLANANAIYSPRGYQYGVKSMVITIDHSDNSVSANEIYAEETALNYTTGLTYGSIKVKRIDDHRVLFYGYVPTGTQHIFFIGKVAGTAITYTKPKSYAYGSTTYFPDLDVVGNYFATCMATGYSYMGFINGDNLSIETNTYSPNNLASLVINTLNDKPNGEIIYTANNSTTSTSSRIAEFTQWTTGGYGVEGSYWWLSSPTTDYYVWYKIPDTSQKVDVITLDQGTKYGTTVSAQTSSNYGGVVALTSTKCIVTSTAASVLNSKVGTYTPSTLAISLGTSYASTGPEDANFYGPMVRLDDNTAAIVYRYRYGGTEYRHTGMILTEAAGVITYNNQPGADTGILPGGYGTRTESIIRLDSTHIAFVDSNNTQGYSLIVGSISGTTITWGSITEIDSDTTNYSFINATAINSTNIAVIYRAYIDAQYSIRIRTFSVSGTTVTEEASSIIGGSTGVGFCKITMVDTNKALAIYSTYDSTYQYTGRIITFSGSSITNLGAEQIVVDPVSNGYYSQMATTDTDTVALVYATGNSIGAMYIDNIYIDSNDIIHHSRGLSFVSGGPPGLSVFDVDNIIVRYSNVAVSYVKAAKPLISTYDGTYFNIDDPITPYYVWFNLDTISTDPAPAGRTAIEVAVTSADSDTTIASTLQSTVNGETDFSAIVSTNTVTITNATAGSVTDQPASETSNLFVTTTLPGYDESTEPTVSGRTAIPVEIPSNWTASDVFNNTQTTLNSHADFTATSVTTRTELLVDWEEETPDGAYSGTFYDVGNGNAATRFGNQSIYVAVGGSAEIQTSFDGITWTSRTADNSYTGDFYGIFFARDIQREYSIITGTSGEIQTSTDCIDWTHQIPDSSYTGAFKAGAFGDGLAVIVGDSGEIQTSTDFVNWTHRAADSSFSGAFNAATYANGLFVIAGTSAEIQTSTDGITWTSRTAAASSTDEWMSAIYGIGLFVIVGNDGEIQTSADGTTWALSKASNFDSYTSVYCGIDTLVAIGVQGEEGASAVIASSTNGTSWTVDSLGFGEVISTGITYNSNGFIIVGVTGKIWNSKLRDYDYIEVENVATGFATAPEILLNAAYKSLVYAPLQIVGSSSSAAVNSNDPAPAGKTKLEILIEDDEYAAYWIAYKTGAIVDANSDFSVSSITDSDYNFTVTNSTAGVTTDASLGTINTLGNYIFSAEVTTQGGNATPAYNSPDPTPAGRTRIEVKYIEDDAALTIEANASNAIDATSDFETVLQQGQPEEFGIYCSSLSTGFADQYFTFSSYDVGGTQNDYYAWLSYNGSGTDPMVPSKTGVEIYFTNPKLANGGNMVAYIVEAINVAGADIIGTYAATKYLVQITPDNADQSYKTQFVNGTARGFGMRDEWTDPSYTDVFLVNYREDFATRDNTDLNGKWFGINTYDGATEFVEFYVWFNVGGNGSDPAPAGKIGLEVAIASDEYQQNIQTAIADTIDLYPAANFSAFTLNASTSGIAKFTGLYPGNATNAAGGTYPSEGDVGQIEPLLDGDDLVPGFDIYNISGGAAPDAADVDTGFTITTTQQGGPAVPLTKWNEVIPVLNTATVGGTWSIFDGDVRLTTDSSGPTATVRLEAGTSGTDLFDTLTGFTAFDDPKDPFPS